MSDTFLSIVVIGRNEGARLIQCFDSILNLELPPYGEIEMIYVDSSSTDGSPLKAKALGFDVVVIPAQNAATARNVGWIKANGQFICFLDGDTVIQPDFILKALPSFTDPKVAVVCGQRKERQPDASFYTQVLNFDWQGPVGDVEACGGDAIIRRSALAEVEGYDSALIAGEDYELCRRLREKGYRVIRLDELMTYHDLGITNFLQYWKRAYRTGYAYAEVSQLYHLSKDPLWKKEALHNLWKGSFMLIALLLCFTSKWALMTILLLGSFLIIRSAWKARVKSNAITQAFLYGLHSHFQHIPMFFGQLAFRFNHWKGKSRAVIDYKK